MDDLSSDELPTTVIPGSAFTCSIQATSKKMLEQGSEWSGPKHKIGLKARRELEMEKATVKRNNPRMIEVSKFPSGDLPAPLPRGLKNMSLVSIVLEAQRDLRRRPSYTQKLKEILNREECQNILKNMFWWFYIETTENSKLELQKSILYKQATDDFAKLTIGELMRNGIVLGKDTFTTRYPTLLAQLVYVVFCWAYPQSHPKFDSNFREHLLKQCSLWIAGINIQPRRTVEWDLNRLEPMGMRVSDQRRGPEDSTVSQQSIYQVVQNASNRGTVKVSMKRSVLQVANINRFIKQAANQPTAKFEAYQPQGYYEFETVKFNAAGISPMLKSHLQHHEIYDDHTCKWQPLLDRTVVTKEVDRVPLISEIKESQKTVKRCSSAIDKVIKQSRERVNEFKTENETKRKEMTNQINTIMRSKSLIHRYADLCSLHMTSKNPVPTEKIVRQLKLMPSS